MTVNTLPLPLPSSSLRIRSRFAACSAAAGHELSRASVGQGVEVGRRAVPRPSTPVDHARCAATRLPQDAHSILPLPFPYFLPFSLFLILLSWRDAAVVRTVVSSLRGRRLADPRTALPLAPPTPSPRPALSRERARVARRLCLGRAEPCTRVGPPFHSTAESSSPPSTVAFVPSSTRHRGARLSRLDAGADPRSSPPPSIPHQSLHLGILLHTAAILLSPTAAVSSVPHRFSPGAAPSHRPATRPAAAARADAPGHVALPQPPVPLLRPPPLHHRQPSLHRRLSPALPHRQARPPPAPPPSLSRGVRNREEKRNEKGMRQRRGDREKERKEKKRSGAH
ncbi:hypothetical protein DAI22_05g059201 [Oryza sativa Japonica Group]|nr:hypothetical protein DAI22_05g059201 [Oryza sativa Japonica Group]